MKKGKKVGWINQGENLSVDWWLTPRPICGVSPSWLRRLSSVSDSRHTPHHPTLSWSQLFSCAHTPPSREPLDYCFRNENWDIDTWESVPFLKWTHYFRGHSSVDLYLYGIKIVLEHNRKLYDHCLKNFIWTNQSFVVKWIFLVIILVS